MIVIFLQVYNNAVFKPENEKLYFEFLFQKYLLKDSHNLHRITNAKVNSKLRIKDNEINPLTTTQKDRSLRTIVLKRMKKLNINETPEEKALRSLTAGP